MLVVIVVVFVVCWTPLLLINILQSLGTISLQIHGWAKHCKTVSSLLAYLNRYTHTHVQLEAAGA